MEKVECQSPLASKMSSAQLRKIKKPIIEKRRRERINDSLNQLKSLVLDAMQKDESRYSKMEKADILEMTVHHLKDCHRQQAVMPDTHTLTSKYTAGYSECANEVSQFLGGMDCLSPELRLRIMSHLSQGLHKSVQRAATSIQAPTPIKATQAYHGSVSPGMIPASTLPCATQIANLPGSTGAQYPSSVSPLHLLTSSPVMPSGVLFVQPGQVSPVSDYSSINSSPCHSPSSCSSPAHSPSSMSSSSSHSPSSVNGAIPLYVAPSAGRYSPIGQPAVNRHSSSPSLGEDAPSRYMEETQTTRDTVIAKNNNNNNNNVISSCNSQARMGYHMDNMVADNGSMWRPW